MQKVGECGDVVLVVVWILAPGAFAEGMSIARGGKHRRYGCVDKILNMAIQFSEEIGKLVRSTKIKSTVRGLSLHSHPTPTFHRQWRIFKTMRILFLSRLVRSPHTSSVGSCSPRASPMSVQSAGRPCKDPTRRVTHSGMRCRAKRVSGHVCGWDVARIGFRSRCWRSWKQILRYRVSSTDVRYAVWTTMTTKTTATRRKCSSTAGRDAVYRSDPLHMNY